MQRTAFEISRDITEALGGKRKKAGDEPLSAAERMLFPQVLAIVERYLADGVSVAPGARKEEIALARYRDVIIDRLLTAMSPT